jgi:hypothetical protein
VGLSDHGLCMNMEFPEHRLIDFVRLVVQKWDCSITKLVMCLV